MFIFVFSFISKHFPLFPSIFRNPSTASIETFQFNLFSRVAYACSFSFFLGVEMQHLCIFFLPSAARPSRCPSLSVSACDQRQLPHVGEFCCGGHFGSSSSGGLSNPFGQLRIYVRAAGAAAAFHPNTKTCSVHPRTLMETGQSGRNPTKNRTTSVVIMVCS